MKKIILTAMLISTMLSLCSGFSTEMFQQKAYSATTTTTKTNWNGAASLKRVNTIGSKILKANSLPQGITFKVSDDESINAYANINKEVYVYRGLLEYVSNDEELAAVIAHEIGHIVNSHSAKQTIVNSVISSISTNTTNTVVSNSVEAAKQLSSMKFSRQDELEADLTAVDLLQKAGYNPLALISVLNKICGNYVDLISTHPSGEKRLMNIYDYADYNYPAIVKKGYNTESYLKARDLIWANLKIRKQSPRKLAKAKKQQEKLKQQRLKRARKMLNSNDPWNTSLNVLQQLSN